MWIEIDKNVFSHNTDVYIGHAYRKPTATTCFRFKNDNFDFFEQLESDFIKYDNLGFVFITGDMNCRTADEYVFILYDKYLDENQPFIYKPDIILRRSSKDKIIDTNGRYLFQLCHVTGLIIANGRLGKDTLGEFTFCNSRGASVVDYLLLKNDTFDLIENFTVTVDEFNEFSDRACLVFSLKIRKSHNISDSERIPTNPQNNETCIIFDSEKATLFQNQLQNSVHLLDNLTVNVNNGQVESLVQDFSQILTSAATDVFGKVKRNVTFKNKLTNKAWFKGCRYSFMKNFPIIDFIQTLCMSRT